MWFSSPQPRSLALVEAFITGFQWGRAPASEPLDFSYFTRWVAARYRINDGAMNGFGLIREKSEEDETTAFDEFFKLLPEFMKDFETIGPDGINARHTEVMGEIRRHF